MRNLKLEYDNESQGLNESGWHHPYSFHPSHSLSYLSASTMHNSLVVSNQAAKKHARRLVESAGEPNWR
jgi:hypothetical protein